MIHQELPIPHRQFYNYVIVITEYNIQGSVVGKQVNLSCEVLIVNACSVEARTAEKPGSIPFYIGGGYDLLSLGRSGHPGLRRSVR